MPDSTPTARTVCAHVVLDLVAASAGEAIEQLAAGFAGIPGAPAARTLAAAVLEREAQASTFLGHAAALPHARLLGVNDLTVAFGRARRPIQLLATECAPKNPAVKTSIPTSTSQSGSASVTTTPASITAIATHSTRRRPSRSASAPTLVEL